MTSIERRAFMKGAALGALAFTVGGAEVLLTPARRGRRRAVPPAQGARRRDHRGAGRDAGARRAQAGIAHFVDHQISVPAGGGAARRRASSTCGRRLRTSIAPPSARSTAASQDVHGRKFAQLSTVEQRDFVNLMRQNKIEGWQGPPGGFVYAVLRSDAVDVVYGTMEGYAALGIPYRPTSRPRRGGDMANEKVDVVIVGAGASGSVFAAVLAKAGKKVVVLEQGPDWQLSDLISSDIWGRRIKPAGGPFLLEGKNPFGYVYQAGWGVGGARCTTSPTSRGSCPNDFKIKSEHGRGLDWPISYQDVAPFYDKVARDIGVSGDAKAEEIWRPAGDPYPMPPMKTFRHGEIWLKGFEAAGIRMVPAAVAMNSTDYKGRPACIYDGWCHVGCPTGALANPIVTYLADAKKAGAEVRALCTVTRVLTNPQGSKVTGVEYYDDKKERQVQEASVVVLAAWSAQNPRLMLNSATDKHPKGLANSSGLVGKYMMAHF